MPVALRNPYLLSPSLMSYLNRDTATLSDRVAYAKKCLLKGYTHGRAFDDCFENGDGHWVMVRLWQIAENDPYLAQKLKGYGTAAARELYKRFGHESPRKIGLLARVGRIGTNVYETARA